ncbi:MAG: hypothetical protein ACK53K_05165 [Burkholderiales bacterium]|jgi:hypothetical protein
MKLHDIMCAVAERLDIDDAFLQSSEAQEHLRLILLSDKRLEELSGQFTADDFIESPELTMCIERAAFILLCDLVRAEEICSALIARCCGLNMINSDDDMFY